MIWAAAPTGRRGRQQTYSDTAIQTCLTMKVMFGMVLQDACSATSHSFGVARHPAPNEVEGVPTVSIEHRPFTPAAFVK